MLILKRSEKRAPIDSSTSGGAHGGFPRAITPVCETLFDHRRQGAQAMPSSRPATSSTRRRSRVTVNSACS